MHRNKISITKDIKRGLALACFTLVSILMAGTFGYVHDHITYSIAPEYFTQFKFQ